MIFLVFSVGENRYVIDGSQAVEVLPLVHWKTVPQAPVGVAGVLNYHGVSVPLIDLADLMLGTPSRQWMSTRIIIAKYHSDSRQDSSPNSKAEGSYLGLLAEQVDGTVHLRETDFHFSGLAVNTTPYLGSVAMGTEGILQRIELPYLLSEELRTQLFMEKACLA